MDLAKHHRKGLSHGEGGRELDSEDSEDFLASQDQTDDCIDDSGPGGGDGGGGVNVFSQSDAWWNATFSAANSSVNLGAWSDLQDRMTFGSNYYNLPGHDNPGAQEEQRYLSILSTAWDPELGRYEWDWHTFNTDLVLATQNQRCASLVGGSNTASQFLAQVPIENANTVMAQVPQPSVQQSGEPNNPEFESYRSMMAALSEIAMGFGGLPAGIFGWPHGKAMAVGPAFTSLSTGQQLTVTLHEMMHWKFPGNATAIDSMIGNGAIQSACGTGTPPIPQGVMF